MASSLSQSPLPAAMRIVHVLLFLTAAVLSSPAKNGRDAFAGLGRDLYTSQLPASVCTLYVAPNGLDKNSGRTPRSAITLLQAARQAVAGDVVCIEPGNYSLARTFARPIVGSRMPGSPTNAMALRQSISFGQAKRVRACFISTGRHFLPARVTSNSGASL